MANSDRQLTVTPPRPGDYGPAAIKKAVLDSGLKHPATVYPLALGASVGFVGFLFGIPYLYIAAAAGMILGPLWGALQITALRDRNGRKHIDRLNRRQEEYEQYLVYMVEKSLGKCRSIKGIEDEAAQGEEQLKRIQEKFENVRELLEMKLRGEELTFGRFFGAARQVSLSVLDNLKDLVGLLKSAGSIRPEYIMERLDKLASRIQRTEQDEKQEKALETQLELRNTQLEKAHRLLTKNEEAMADLEKISAAIAEWQTDTRFAATDFESAITRLQELAAQAHEYNI